MCICMHVLYIKKRNNALTEFKKINFTCNVKHCYFFSFSVLFLFAFFPSFYVYIYISLRYALILVYNFNNM